MKSPQAGRPFEAADDEAGHASWLLCRTGARLCAIPIQHVIETMRVLPIEAVSGAPRYVLGLCIIRGAPVAVIDIGLLVGDQVTCLKNLITVRTGSRTIAFATEAVVGAWTAGAGQLGRLPPLLRDAAADTVVAIGALDHELVFLLNAARLVPEDLLDRPEFRRAPS